MYKSYPKPEIKTKLTGDIGEKHWKMKYKNIPLPEKPIKTKPIQGKKSSSLYIDEYAIYKYSIDESWKFYENWKVTSFGSCTNTGS